MKLLRRLSGRSKKDIYQTQYQLYNARDTKTNRHLNMKKYEYYENFLDFYRRTM